MPNESDILGPIDRTAADEEWKRLKPLLIREKCRMAGRPAREFANHLLNNHLPESLYPQIRRMILIMLLIPASSVQSERDFSAQARIKVKGRASLGSSEAGVQALDELMRIYLLPRASFYSRTARLSADVRVPHMRKDPVTHILASAEGRAICLQAWQAWWHARTENKKDKNHNKRTATAAELD